MRNATQCGHSQKEAVRDRGRRWLTALARWGGQDRQKPILEIARNQSTRLSMKSFWHDPTAGDQLFVGRRGELGMRVCSCKASEAVRINVAHEDLCSSLEGRWGNHPFCALCILSRSIKFILSSCRGEVCDNRAPILVIFRINNRLLFFVCCIDAMTYERTCKYTCTERCTHSHCKCSLVRVCKCVFTHSCVVKHTLLNASMRSATAAQDLLN